MLAGIFWNVRFFFYLRRDVNLAGGCLVRCWWLMVANSEFPVHPIDWAHFMLCIENCLQKFGLKYIFSNGVCSSSSLVMFEMFVGKWLWLCSRVVEAFFCQRVLLLTLMLPRFCLLCTTRVEQAWLVCCVHVLGLCVCMCQFSFSCEFIFFCFQDNFFLKLFQGVWRRSCAGQHAVRLAATSIDWPCGTMDAPSICDGNARLQL